jgi:hypothetical protein
MSDLEAEIAKIDGLLRRCLAASVPSLPPDFDQRLMREINRGSQPLDRYRRILLMGYGLVSAAVSAAVMRGQGLNWPVVASMMLAPLALVVAVRWARRATLTLVRHSAT